MSGLWSCATSPKNGRILRLLGNWRPPSLPFALVKDSLPWRSEKVQLIIAKARKTNDGRWSRVAATRDLPTIAFFRAGVLLRRSVTCPRHSRNPPARGDYG